MHKIILKLIGFAWLSLILAISPTLLMAQAKVLVFTKTAGFHHPSIEVGKQVIIKLGKENHFVVDTTSDSTKITESNLKKYAALVFLNTTGRLLNNYQQADLQRYIQ